MYQFRWLTVSGSSASGLVILPAKISAFFSSQAALRALIFGLLKAGAAMLAETPCPGALGMDSWFR